MSIREKGKTGESEALVSWSYGSPKVECSFSRSSDRDLGERERRGKEREEGFGVPLATMVLVAAWVALARNERREKTNF